MLIESPWKSVKYLAQIRHGSRSRGINKINRVMEFPLREKDNMHCFSAVVIKHCDQEQHKEELALAYGSVRGLSP